MINLYYEIVEFILSYPVIAVFIIFSYLYFCLCQMILANRMGFSYTWMAFIPIADKYLLAKMGGRNFWKIFASFVLSPIPTVGFIFDLIFIFEVFCCWCNVSNYFGKKWYWTVLLFMPIVNFFVMGILIYQTKNHLNDTSYSR